MNPAGSVTYNVQISTSGLAGQINNVNSQLGQAGQKGSAAFGAKFGAVAGITQSIFNKAFTAVSSSIDGAVKRVDTLNNAPKVLQNLGHSAADSQKAIDLLSGGIQGLPTRLDAAATALTGITAATGKGVIEATALTLAFNNMALSGGKGPEEAQRALTQYTQALSRGRFEGEEFNTMMEVMPAQMTQVAKSLLGPTANAGTLKEAMSKGQITMEQFNDQVVRLDKEGGEGFSSFSKQAKDATGGVGTGLANMQTAISRGIASIIESVGSANIVSAIDGIGKAFETALGFIAATIKFIIDNKNVFIPIGIAIGVVTAFMVAFNLVMAAHGVIMSVVSAATTTWATIMKVVTAAQWLWNAAMAANPIGLIIIAIAALVAGLIWFFTQTEVGRKMFQGFLDFMKGVWDAILVAINFVWNWLKENWPLILAILTGPIGIAVLMIIKHWDTIKEAFAKAWEFIKDVWSAVVGYFKAVWNGIVTVFSVVVDFYRSIFTNAWNAIKSVFSAVGGFFRGVWNTIVSIFGNIGSAIGNAVGGAVKGAVNGALSIAENAVNGFINLINGAIKLINKIPGVNIGNVGRISLPRLARGGIVDSPTQAIIGEAGAEAVVPLENNTEWIDKIAKKMGGAGGPTTIIVKLGEETIATRVIDLINEKTKLSGSNSILV